MINSDLKDKLETALVAEIERSIDRNYWEWIDQLLEVAIKIKHLDQQ